MNYDRFVGAILTANSNIQVCCKLFLRFTDNEQVDLIPTVIATLMFGNATGASSGSRISPFIKQNFPNMI